MKQNHLIVTVYFKIILHNNCINVNFFLDPIYYHREFSISHWSNPIPHVIEIYLKNSGWKREYHIIKTLAEHVLV